MTQEQDLNNGHGAEEKEPTHPDDNQPAHPKGDTSKRRTAVKKQEPSHKTPDILYAPPAHPSTRGRWLLIRDVTVFQAKLFIDGIRDIILSPLSLLAALAGILSKNGEARKYYDQVMRLGERTETWIDLFHHNKSDPSGLDRAITHLENDLRARYKQGGIAKTVKDKVDSAIDGDES